MKLSDWLDEKEADNRDPSQIELPKEMYFDQDPDETVFFQEYKPCGLLCAESHPFSKVERFGHWYYCSGQDKRAGIHSSEMKWRLTTRDKELALQTAKSHIE